MSRRNRPEQETESGDAKIETSERLQKVLAAAGLGSRRDCEELITQGRVEIDRQVASELGTKVDPLRQEIRVDGVVLHRPKRLYFAVNKPPGVVTTNFDPSGRPRVIDLVPTEERVFAVGRLDRASEGLILVTNDGELANRVTHPRYGVEKTYHVRVEGAPDNEQLLRLRRGVRIAEGLARVQSVRVKSRHKNVSDLEIILNEGKNREIRRILAKVGHKVLSLKRVAVGPVKLGELKSGTCRKLMPQEIESLIEASRQRRKDNKKKGGRSSAPSDTKGRRPSPAPLPAPAPAPVAGSAPPKIDLATLLNPALAPKHAMPVTPVPQASRPSIGDVISYETPDADASVAPLQAPPKKRRRPLREYETDSEPIELGAANEPPPIPIPMRTPRPGRTSRPRDAEPRKGAAPGVRTPRSRFRSQPRSMAKYAKTEAPRSERGSSGAPRKGRSNQGRANQGLAKPGARRGPGKHRGPAASKGPQRGPGKFRKRRGK